MLKSYGWWVAHVTAKAPVRAKNILSSLVEAVVIGEWSQSLWCWSQSLGVMGWEPESMV